MFGVEAPASKSLRFWVRQTRAKESEGLNSSMKSAENTNGYIMQQVSSVSLASNKDFIHPAVHFLAAHFRGDQAVMLTLRVPAHQVLQLQPTPNHSNPPLTYCSLRPSHPSASVLQVAPFTILFLFSTFHPHWQQGILFGRHAETFDLNSGR